MSANHYFLQPPGLINALGTGIDEIAQRLVQTPTALSPYDALLSGRTTQIGEVSAVLPELPEALKGYQCRNAQLLLSAYQQIQSATEQVLARFGPHRLGVVIGTSTSGIARGEWALKQQHKCGEFPGSYHYRQQEAGSAAEFLAILAGALGPSFTVSTACSSSGKVFASATRLLEAGLCDAVLVGGADSLCELTLNGFDALESLASTQCNPFSVNRSGINIGEGAALFLLTRDEGPVRLLGVGESSDGYHISAPDPSGQGAEIALQSALAQAQLSPDQVGYINLHGTATPKNDAMESHLIARLFGQDTPCSSTKPYSGHTLGAAGATELAFCYLTLQGMPLPQHHWDGQKDAELAQLWLLEEPLSLGSRQVCMSNSFAFGGSNVSVLIGAA